MSSVPQSITPEAANVTPTQCYFNFEYFDVDTQDLQQALASAGIQVLEMEMSGNGESSNCGEKFYGEAVHNLSISLDASAAKDDAVLGSVLAKVLDVLKAWIKAPAWKFSIIDPGNTWLKIQFSPAGTTIEKGLVDLFNLQDQGLDPANLWQAALQK
jgi:hypothetical protein